MWYKVTLNGIPLRRWMTKAEAYAMAERWQGSHCSYGGASGLLKIKDRGDHVEAKPDIEADREWDERLKVAKAGERQTVHYQQRVESLEHADPEMRS